MSEIMRVPEIYIYKLNRVSANLITSLGERRGRNPLSYSLINVNNTRCFRIYINQQ